MATKKSKCSQTGDLNLQEGAIFSRSLNDNGKNDYDRAIFYKIFQSECLF